MIRDKVKVLDHLFVFSQGNTLWGQGQGVRSTVGMMRQNEDARSADCLFHKV